MKKKGKARRLNKNMILSLLSHQKAKADSQGNYNIVKEDMKRKVASW